jgi:hypothetical protein
MVDVEGTLKMRIMDIVLDHKNQILDYFEGMSLMFCWGHLPTPRSWDAYPKARRHLMIISDRWILNVQLILDQLKKRALY